MNDKPVTAREAVEAYNALRQYCKAWNDCHNCPFHDFCQDTLENASTPDYWPDIKEAPDA